MLLQSGVPEEITPLCSGHSLSVLTGPLNTWRVEMEQWALGWGQSPTESCPRDGEEMGNRDLAWKWGISGAGESGYSPTT